MEKRVITEKKKTDIRKCVTQITTPASRNNQQPKYNMHRLKIQELWLDTTDGSVISVNLERHYPFVSTIPLIFKWKIHPRPSYDLI